MRAVGLPARGIAGTRDDRVEALATERERDHRGGGDIDAAAPAAAAKEGAALAGRGGARSNRHAGRFLCFGRRRRDDLEDVVGPLNDGGELAGAQPVEGIVGFGQDGHAPIASSSPASGPIALISASATAEASATALRISRR